ncbi:MAG TPA: histidine phosphatase family protein [Ktedonobacteraceae bacterium]|nr:histidine phosphatase family protein [Ktedonobacteraceae bacterium]
MQDPFLLKRNQAAELFIVRHGDAIPEEDEIIPSGIYDDLPLSRIGREQAEALAERLSDARFDAMYSSPLLRCQQTAAPLAERLRMTPTLVPGIREIRLGQIRPLPENHEDVAALTQALKERQVDIVRIAGATGHWDALENSEPSKEFRQRVVDAMDEVASKHIGQRVIVFCHGGVINAYVAEVLGLEKDFFFPAANTSITVVRVAGKQRVLYVMNDIAHVKRHG